MTHRQAIIHATVTVGGVYFLVCSTAVASLPVAADKQGSHQYTGVVTMRETQSAEVTPVPARNVDQHAAGERWRCPGNMAIQHLASTMAQCHYYFAAALSPTRRCTKTESAQHSQPTGTPTQLGQSTAWQETADVMTALWPAQQHRSLWSLRLRCWLQQQHVSSDTQ